MSNRFCFGRQCEFGRAALQRMLSGTHARPSLAYIGFLRPDQADIKSDLEEMVYSHWDSSPQAPARSRPVEPQPEPSLGFLTWSNGVARFPEAAFHKFPEGSVHYQELSEMKKQLVAEFPSSGTVAATTAQTRATVQPPARATGRPDFSIDGGAEPIDVSRVLVLEYVATNALTVERTCDENPHQSCFIGMVLF